jgi:hypothetical protein
MQTVRTKKIAQPKVRRIKILPQMRINQWSTTPIAELRMRGLWLIEMGFVPEKRVTITTMNKMMIIKVDD